MELGESLVLSGAKVDYRGGRGARGEATRGWGIDWKAFTMDSMRGCTEDRLFVFVVSWLRITDHVTHEERSRSADFKISEDEMSRMSRNNVNGGERGRTSGEAEDGRGRGRIDSGIGRGRDQPRHPFSRATHDPEARC